MATVNCDWAKANLTFYVYDEVADDVRFEMERHIARCDACAAELRDLRELRDTMSAITPLEPTPNLLAAARIHLQEELEHTEQHHGWRLLDPAAWLRQLKFSPALAAVLVIIGFAAGTGTGWRIGTGSNVAAITENGNPVVPTEASIGGIRGISQQPGSDQVQIAYDTVVPQKLEGSLNDKRIQQLLLFAARNTSNSGVRMDSVDLLTKSPTDNRIREALQTALLYDSNPGVRLKALEALGPFVGQDMKVRNAVLEALQEDSNPGVRAEAIHLLQPVRVDSSVRQVLHSLSKEDESQYIRTQATRMLASLPEID